MAVFIKRAYPATFVAVAFLIMGLVWTAGCGPNATSDQAEASPAVLASPAVPTNRVITDLSQISTANTVPAIAPAPIAATRRPSPNPNAAVQHNLARLFASNPDAHHYSDEPTPPGDTRLLNAKAREFADFSYALLHQTMMAEQASQNLYLKRRKLPNNLRSVILTATMTSRGKLTDIAINQQSGDLAVDKMVIEACKKGLWTRNPPAGALASDGVYRLRVEASINNYSFDRDDNYTYDTHLGLGLL
jgi:hypothetical protein